MPKRRRRSRVDATNQFVSIDEDDEEDEDEVSDDDEEWNP